MWAKYGVMVLPNLLGILEDLMNQMPKRLELHYVCGVGGFGVRSWGLSTNSPKAKLSVRTNSAIFYYLLDPGGPPVLTDRS